MNLFPSFIRNEHIDIETTFNIYFSSISSKKGEGDLNPPNYGDSYISVYSIIDPDPMPSFNELFPIHPNDSESKTESFSSLVKTNLSSNIEKNSILVKKIDDKNMLKRKRFKKRRPRMENQDNMRKKIKRGFLNNALIKKLNEKLRSLGYKNYFKKFPKLFVNDVNKKRNKEIFNMTLRDIFEKEEIYSNEDKNSLFYLWNLKLVQSREINENEEFKKILNETICELYEEYINSDEFKIIEINRLKEKKMQEEYINRYINLARCLVLFFNQ